MGALIIRPTRIPNKFDWTVMAYQLPEKWLYRFKTLKSAKSFVDAFIKEYGKPVEIRMVEAGSTNNNTRIIATDEDWVMVLLSN